METLMNNEENWEENVEKLRKNEENWEENVEKLGEFHGIP